MNRRLAALVAAALGLTATGCSTTLGDIPLPGTGVSGDTITVEAEFAEALNLATGATVKVNGINSGKVQEVEVADFTARAELLVQTQAELREGATARLRYTTPLGELFVDVTNPTSGPLMADGEVIELDDTSTAPTVEDALSQASLLINGGGLGDLQVVTEELNTVLGGREDTVRSLLERSRDFLTEANATTADIDRALRSLSSVSTTLERREQIINRAVREITPAARVLRENTPGLTLLLQEVERFSATANDTVQRTRRQILRLLDQAVPVLQEFNQNSGRFGPSLDSLVGLQGLVDNIVPNDYAAISLAVQLDDLSGIDLLDLLDQLGIPLQDLLDDLGIPGLPLPDLSGILDPPRTPARGADPASLSGLLSPSPSSPSPSRGATGGAR